MSHDRHMGKLRLRGRTQQASSCSVRAQLWVCSRLSWLLPGGLAWDPWAPPGHAALGLGFLTRDVTPRPETLPSEVISWPTQHVPRPSAPPALR